MKPLRLIKTLPKFQDEVVRRAFQYEQDVLSGKQIACQRMKKAALRSIRLREKYSYSEEQLRKVAAIFYHLYIPISDRPTQFLPAPWQCWILLNLFAIINPTNGRRIHTEALVFVSRKSGKTMFGAALSLIFLTKYGGLQAECFGAATVQKQAKQLMEYAKLIVRNSPALKRRIKTFRDELHYDDGDSKNTLVQLSELQADRADGSNPSYCLYDEAHAFKNDALKEVIITGMGARANPLFLTVSTAGFLTVGYPLFTQVELADKVLNGDVEDDNTFYALYSLDSEEEAKSDDIGVLEKANPGLGTAVSIDRLIQMRDKAMLLPSSWKNFLVKNCNIFQTSVEDPFISDENFLTCCSPIPFDELKGARAWIGLDLSQSVDLTAFTVLVEHPETKMLHVIPFHFFPKRHDSKIVRANGVDLSEWIDAGYITEHDERIDLNNIYERLLSIYEAYDVQMVGYDPYHARDLLAKLSSNLEILHIPVVPVSQSITTLSTPTKYLEELVISKQINLGQNPVFRYCNSNARIKFSQTSNLIRVIKDEQLNPIDSVISTIVALAVYMETEFSTLTHLLKDN